MENDCSLLLCLTTNTCPEI